MVKSVSSMARLANADPVTRAFMVLMQAANALPKYADSRFHGALKLSLSKYVALLVLAVNGGKMRPIHLAAWTGTRRHNITTLVDRMSRDGLVVARRSERDRRVVEVSLTEAGREAYERALPVARSIMAQVMSGVTREDAARLEKVLQSLMANVAGTAAP